ncbi:MAG TPA: TolC family protein [Candidatus Binatia bacterium]
MLVLVGASVLSLPRAARSLDVTDYDDETKLAAALWQHAPEVIDARSAAASAAGDLRRARTLPNPTLDFTWGTMPIGETNPPDLHDPWSHVPNYTVGISELIELGKRGPRAAAAAAQLEQAQAQALATLGTRFFALLAAIGDIARSQARAGVLNAQVHAGDDTIALERARASKGETATADLERAELEQMRLVAARDSARSDLETARGACAAIVASPCPAFPTARAAREYLRREAAATAPRTWSPELEKQRPDIAALDAALHAADEQARLARRKAIPDVTVRAGYTYDTFEAAGNQRQSAALGVQVPLPVFDRGQADLQTAEAALAKARDTRAALVETARTTLETEARQRVLVARRIEQMSHALDTARSVRSAMEGAAREGGTSQLDVLLAQRSHQDLLLARTDLDGEAFTAALKIREAAGDFPRTRYPEGAAP